MTKRETKGIRRNAVANALASAVLSVTFLSGGLVRGTVLDDIGVTALRTEQPELNGAGVVVAQPEASPVGGSPPVSLNQFEVNPAAASTPSGVTINYVNSSGTMATGFPNGVGTEFSHGDTVASLFYGSTQGPADGVTVVWNYDAGYFINNIILRSAPPAIAAKVVNQSFIFSTSSPADAATALQLYDNYVDDYGTVIVSGAGNGGGIQLPSSAYNVISVAAYGGSSSVGPVSDGRSKPDITAPADATSFSTPLVSGVATILVQAGNLGLGGPGTQTSAVDPRTVKALLLNGAVKPGGWIHTMTAPLDTRYGAGIVNALQSYHDLAAGEKAPTSTLAIPLNQTPGAISTGPTVGLEGWNLQQITSNDSTDQVDHYLINVSSGGSLFALTATMTWNRGQGATPTTVNAINNLDFYLYNAANSTQLAASISGIDNVEHLGSIVLAPGIYDLEVLKHGGSASNPGGTNTAPNWVSDSETYALAWNTETITPMGSTITSSNGYLEFVGSQVVPNITTNAVQVNAGATLDSGALNLGSLSVNGTHTLHAGSAVSKVSTLSIAHTGSGSSAIYSGVLQLNNNRLILQATDPADKANKILSLNEALFFGKGTGGSWTGAKGITSSAAAANSVQLTVGVYDNAHIGKTNFAGGVGNADPNSLFISAGIKGDLNLDGVVDTNDLALLGANWHVTGGLSAGGISNLDMTQGDINQDGVVDTNDLALLGANWHATSSFNLVASLIADAQSGDLDALATAGFNVSPSQVPEPTSVALLALGSAALVSQRKRKHWRVG